jgi:hypothetical protein
MMLYPEVFDLLINFCSFESNLFKNPWIHELGYLGIFGLFLL